jgi:cell filamentation protein
MIERASVFAAGELHSENALRRLDCGRFIDRLAYHYDQVNYIHPFREGNGRVQRVFWNRIALAAGWQLDWRPVHGDVNDRASRAISDQRDLDPLRAMFDQIVTPAPLARNRGKSWREAERQRMSFTKPEPT